MMKLTSLLVLASAMLLGFASAWTTLPTSSSSRIATSTSENVAFAIASRSSASQRFMSSGADDGTVFTGTVKWFDTTKGFGFIVPNDGSSDVFVHQTAIITEGFRSLADGENVEYKLSIDPNGRRKAVDVTGPNGAQVQGAPFRPENNYNSY